MRQTHRKLISLAGSLLLAATVQAQQATQEVKPVAAPQKIVEQGIAIEFTADPLLQSATRIRAAEDVNLKFKVTDTTTGTPVKGLGLSAWISLREGDKASEPGQCREKIQSYLTGSLRTRPDVDLNSYYVLALNKSPDISVIDPLLGFGGSKLLTLVMLKSPGEDWLLTRDGERLFVTLPLIDQVAVIDTRSWKVTDYLDTGSKPTRIIVQPDQQYLWVASEGTGGGVTVIDPAKLKVVAKVETGAGQHDIAISNDNQFAFVSNRQSGTVSIIDVRKLEKLKDISVGPGPVSMALSDLSKALYVFGIEVMNSFDAAKAQQGWPSQISLVRMWMKPTPS